MQPIDLRHQVVIQAIRTYHESKSDNEFVRIRARQTAKLWKDLYDIWNERKNDRFYGHNPLTGLPCQVIFNEPGVGRASIMNWNPLLESWMYSADAGLTWKRVEFNDYIEKVDCLHHGPKYAS